MKKMVRLAADKTIVTTMDRGVSLREAAVVVRTFLVNLQPTISKWRPWIKYAIAAVVAILDILVEDHEESLS